MKFFIQYLFFTKETNCRQNFCFVSNLIAFVPTLFHFVFFSYTYVYVCVLSLPALVGKNNSQHLFHLLWQKLHFFCTFLAHYYFCTEPDHLYWQHLAELASLTILAASSRVGELHNCTSMALLCIHFLDHISQQQKTSPKQHRTLCSSFGFWPLYRLPLSVKVGAGGGALWKRTLQIKLMKTVYTD